MKTKLIVLSLCMIASVSMVQGQVNKKDFAPSENRHEFRLAASDGLTLGVANVFGMGLADALLGSKRTDEKSTLVYGVGYRYAIKRFRVGADIGFAQVSSKLTLAGDKTPSYKERELNFLVLPTAEFVYYKRKLVELYGSAAAGVNFIRHSETGLTDIGKRNAKKDSSSQAFAYQVNPIAVRSDSRTRWPATS